MNEALPLLNLDSAAKPEPRSDQELIAAANDGDSAAFELLYERYRDWVARLAYRFLLDEDLSLDVLQDTFLYLLKKFPGFKLTCHFKTFLYPVVKNLSLTQLRKRRRVEPMPDDYENVAAPVAAAQGSPGDLDGALANLAGPQREVLLLRFQDDLPLAEIAEALEIPLGTVKSRLHNALETLRQDPRTREFFAP